MAKRPPLAELVRRARAARGITQFALARKLGCTDSYIAKIETGRAYPSAKFLVELFRELSIEKKHLVQALPQALRAIVQKAMRGAPPSPAPWPRLPVFGEIVAGPPTEAKQQVLGELEVLPETWSPSRYVLKVAGDSMVPTIQPGDLLLVDTSLVPRQNDIVACVINREATLKRYIKRGTIVLLKADNPAFPDIIPVTSTDEFRIQGVVVKIVERNLRAS